MALIQRHLALISAQKCNFRICLREPDYIKSWQCLSLWSINWRVNVSNFALNLFSSFMGDTGVILPLLIHPKGTSLCSRLVEYTHTHTQCNLFVVCENIFTCLTLCTRATILTPLSNSGRILQPNLGIRPLLTRAARQGVLKPWSVMAEYMIRRHTLVPGVNNLQTCRFFII